MNISRHTLDFGRNSYCLLCEETLLLLDVDIMYIAANSNRMSTSKNTPA
jgi:hypothetical protein